MKITKFGHCCLLVEENNLRILTDPGNYSSGQDNAKGIDVILITHHEHQDHLFLDSLRRVLQNNPSAKVMTNRSVAGKLEGEGIPSRILEEGEEISESGVRIDAIGTAHSVIYPSLPQIHNTGYFISGRFFYPGDSLTHPNRPVDILALPVSALWLKLSESIDFAKAIRPNICFPVHDGNVRTPESMYRTIKNLLEPDGIRFVLLDLGKETVF
jgi:L-ascorbate metabolism protein UlaG (beta-lactamase superfamily)